MPKVVGRCNDGAVSTPQDSGKLKELADKLDKLERAIVPVERFDGSTSFYAIDTSFKQE